MPSSRRPPPPSSPFSSCGAPLLSKSVPRAERERLPQPLTSWRCPPLRAGGGLSSPRGSPISPTVPAY
eukprot:7745249-Alexandrium_andersonii.AAC.1